MRENKILKYLVCPFCGSGMSASENERSLFCKGDKLHCFDFSSKGYVNLASGRSNTGDSKQAVSSRTDFLNKEYYAPIADKLIELLKKYVPGGFVIDAGCGEGYYTEKIASNGYLAAGVDLSKFAVASAAARMKCKINNNTFACVASIFDMPFADSCANAIVSIFAPCAEEETLRLLGEDGIFIVVSAGENHLMGLKEAIYDKTYKNDVRADTPESLELCEAVRLEYQVTLNENTDILNLFSMTPYYWRTSPTDADKLVEMDSLTTAIDIIFSVYKKKH